MNLWEKYYPLAKRVRLDKPRINRALAHILLSRVFLIPVFFLLLVLLAPCVMAYWAYHSLRQRIKYGCRGFKHIYVNEEPVLALALLIVGTEAEEHVVAFNLWQRRTAKTGLKGSHPWAKRALPKLRSAIVRLEKRGAKLTVNNDTLCAYFYGAEIETEYPRLRAVFEVLKNDPDFGDTRLGVGLSNSSPYATEESAFFGAIKDAMAQPA
jgi:hypothetical protein